MSIVPPPEYGHGLLRTPRAYRRKHGPGDIPFPGNGNPDKIESLLEQRAWENAALLARARSAMATLVGARLGGDCWASDPGVQALGLPERGMVLVVAEDGYDLCPLEARTDEAAQQRMLDAVCAERGHRDVLVFAPRRRKRAPLRDAIIAQAVARGWRIMAQPLSPWTLLDAAATIYTMGHEIGLLALLRGQTVRCFGRPYYAGWGLTSDDSTVAPRAFRRSVEEIFAVACLLALTYVDLFLARPCSFESFCAQLAEWHRVNEANRRIAVCIGMSFWKRRRLTEFLSSTERRPVFRRTIRGAVETARKRGGAIAVWATREAPGLADAASRACVPLIRVEDGFVRSVGLGADFMPAASIVVDDRGIYYDPASGSALEAILGNSVFDPVLTTRARQLILTLTAGGITKYNTGGTLAGLGAPPNRRRIFVPGQVVDDRSVVLGGAVGIPGNLELLARVREQNPDAFIVYKPHPDVDAGHRRGAIADRDVARFADQLVRGVSSAAIIALVDEVHTLSSLTGFEALLRGCRVVVYGQPFYAGWGLTIDVAPLPRRQRRLRIEELVAGALILYPRYLDPVTRLPCGPELVIDRLSNAILWKPGVLVWLRRLQGAVMRRLS